MLWKEVFASQRFRQLPRTILLAMRLIMVFLLAGSLTVSAKAFTQITLSQKDVPLSTVFKEIQKQAGYDFFYSYDVLQKAGKVTVNVKNATIEQVMNACLMGTELTYVIVGKTIAIKSKVESPKTDATSVPSSQPPGVDISGKITNEEGSPLEGANVKVKGSNLGTTTNADGVFVLKGVEENAVLEISYVGYMVMSIAVENRVKISVALKAKPEALQEVVVRKGYYNEKRALSTGNVSTVSAKDIEKQPVNNLLLTMQGIVPGMEITQYTGTSGSGVGIKIRGQNSVANGNEPLYIIDGVPYPSSVSLSNVANSLYLFNGSGTVGTLNTINPADIETIDVLKDADATAIYGSRGANGVVLITTKRGKAGKIRGDMNLQTGFGEVARRLEVLNTQQYLQMRREAFKNDGVNPNPNTDYDLFLWDSTRNVNWQKELIGGKASYTDVHGSISGGSQNAQFLFGAAFHRETTVMPGDFDDQKGSAHLNFNIASLDKKLSFEALANYSLDQNKLPTYDFTSSALRLAPNAPALYNPDGTINWALDARGFSSWPNGNNNPAAMLLNRYKSVTNNLVSNNTISYNLTKGLVLKSTFGYTNINNKQSRTIPLTSFQPAVRSTVQRASQFQFNNYSTWLIEPQASFTKTLLAGEVTALIGGTFQRSESGGHNLQALGFSSDLQLENLSAATSVTAYSVDNVIYKYNAIFGRINYNFQDRYLVNITGRRDGTSRFGPDNRFHNFGAVGLGWVFSREKFAQKFRMLSHGKFRASFGSTGSDQVGDYRFMDLYASQPFGVPYQGVTPLRPTNIYNPELGWEETQKVEAALELGFLTDRLVLITSAYRNRSSNQLLGFPLPTVAGFLEVNKNLDALVENKGLEIELRTQNIVTDKGVQWVSSLNFTLSRNRLVSFSDAGSNYFRKVGGSLNSQELFHFLGVDPVTGLYQVADKSGKATLTPNWDQDAYFVDLTPKFFGGFQNTISFKTLQLDVLFQYVNRPNAFIYVDNGIPGTFVGSLYGKNQPLTVLDRWQNPGDVKPIQKFSQNSNYSNQWSNAFNSDQRIGSGSYVRLKNVSLSWDFSSHMLQRLKLKTAKCYLRGQNLLTLTNYQGLDPETQSSVLPPLRVLTVGIQVGL